MREIFGYVRNYLKEFILGPIFKLLEALFELIVPIVTAKIIDEGIAGRDSAQVLRLTGVIVLLGVCGLGFALTCQYLAAKCAYGFGTELREGLYRHINSLSYTGIDRIGASSLVNRLTNDTNMVQNGLNMLIRLGTRAPFLVIGAAVMAATIDLKLSIVLFVVAPFISVIIYFIMKKTVVRYRENQRKLDRVAMMTRENIEGTRVIRAFSRQNEEIDKFGDAVSDLADSACSVGRISAILNPVSFLVMNLGIVAITWFGGIRIDSGSLTQGELTAFINYMTQILLALVVLANLIDIFTKAFASANRISEVFRLEPEHSDGDKMPDPENCAGNVVEFRDVTFSYEGTGGPALKNISFSVRKGETLGIIGSTGCGKTSVSALIPFFYRADSGQVLVYGEDVTEYDPESLRRTIGVVPQKAVLFSGTVRDNMRWRKEDADDGEIIAALKTAQAWEFVEKMPDRLDTWISQGGRNLSGGQKQRLTIARALVGCPSILILDDSASALDYATDLALRRALKTDLPDTTVIMISQRTTSLRDAESVLVLEDGEVAGVGTHDELLEKCAVYREIYDSQMNDGESGKNA